MSIGNTPGVLNCPVTSTICAFNPDIFVSAGPVPDIEKPPAGVPSIGDFAEWILALLMLVAMWWTIRARRRTTVRSLSGVRVWPPAS